MHTRRLITFLLGAWFALVLTVAGVAMTGTNVAVIISKSPPPEPGRALNVIGQPMTEELFHFVAAEVNRAVFEATGLFELVLVLVLSILLFVSNYNRTATILSSVLLLAVCSSHFLVTPQLVAQGRLLDFRPVEMMLNERVRFANVERLFAGLMIFRVICATWISVILIHRGQNSRMRRRSTDKVDAVDHA